MPTNYESKIVKICIYDFFKMQNYTKKRNKNIIKFKKKYYKKFFQYSKIDPIWIFNFH